MRLLQRFKREETRVSTLEELLLTAGIGTETITKEQALSIPSVAASTSVISDTVASLPIYLYKEENGKVTKIEDDIRVSLLNNDTKDTLDAFQFKKVLIEDYLLGGAGYAYINRERNKVKSLHYVNNTNLSVNINADPIFKSYDILVNGATYRDFEFIKLTRKTKDGVTGTGIVAENNRMISVAYNMLNFENILAATGGSKKGFLKSKSRLSKDAFDSLKEAWKKLYQNNTDNLVLLNDGLEFQEASSTSVELQMNENKKTNSAEICKIFITPSSVLDGSATEDEYNNWIKICILPILKALETSLNKDLLLPSEKKSFYFSCDISELIKGDIEKRFKAYSEAVKSGWISKNEIRYKEDLESIEGLDVVTMSLGEVIYDIKSKKYFTPNTDSITGAGMNKESNREGGDNIAN